MYEAFHAEIHVALGVVLSKLVFSRLMLCHCEIWENVVKRF